MEKALLEFIRKKERISVPDLQYHLGVSYNEAKKLLSTLFDKSLAKRESVGIYHELNFGSVNKRPITSDHLAAFSSKMSINELDLFIRLLKKETGIEKEETLELREYLFERLISRGLAHAFDGRYFASVECDEILELEFGVKDRSESIMHLSLSLPIANVFAKREKPDISIHNPLVPNSCRKYILSALLCRKITGRFNILTYYESNERTDRIICDKIISSFLLNTDLSSKEDYLQEAYRALAEIEASSVCRDEYKRLAKRAVERFASDYTEERISELKDEFLAEEEDDFV